MDLTELKLNQFAIAQAQGVIDGSIDPSWFESWQDKYGKTPPEPSYYLKLLALNNILGESGVEEIIEDGKHIASYVNNGDTYAPTILYDVEKEEFIVTSWGDFLGEWQAENLIEIDCDRVAKKIHTISHSEYVDWDEWIENGETDDDPHIDIRLQVTEEDGWTVHFGLSDFDSDHRGAWGGSSFGRKISMEDAKAIAKDLIEQATEAADYNLTKSVRCSDV